MKQPQSGFGTKAFIIIGYIFTYTFSANTQWFDLNSNTTDELREVYFTNSLTGFLVVNRFIQNSPSASTSRILKTTDSGASWQQVYSDSNSHMSGIAFIDENNGMVVGGLYNFSGDVYKTSNGGNNWIKVNKDPLEMSMYNVVYINASTAYAGGPHGVFKTIDGGNNWQFSLYHFKLSFNFFVTVGFSDANTGILTWGEGKIYRTTNSGTNWSEIQVSNNTAFSDVKFTDNTTGFMAGDSGRIYKSTNAGANWFELNSGSNNYFFSIAMLNANTGYIAGSRNIIKTTNGGGNWFSVYQNPERAFLSAFFLDVSTGYVCGINGKIMQTTTGGIIGINQISGEVPSGFSLQQNYPNPFNPVTKIKFSIPVQGVVKLTVYDIQGREIEVLVNKSFPAGSYEAEFNGAKLSSGIYLYRIETGTFTETRKMVLVK